MKTMRLIFTYDCDRNCSGCCNKNWKFDPPIEITEEELQEEIKQFEQIIITGGEPTNDAFKLHKFFERNVEVFSEKNVILYTAEPYNFLQYIKYCDGITLTLHDKKSLRQFNILEKHYRPIMDEVSLRLNVFNGMESEIIENVNGDWDIRPLKWIEDCPLPKNEKLYKLK